MSDQDYRSFDDFWPFYVKEHQKKSTRILHFIGTTGAMACVAGGLLTKRRWLLAVAPVVTASLSADHRVSDGHGGAVFLDEVARLLQDPGRLC